MTARMTSVRSVDHVQLPVPIGGSKQARAFYEGLLGLREVRDPAHDRPGSLHYALGWGRLDLIEPVADHSLESRHVNDIRVAI